MIRSSGCSLIAALVAALVFASGAVAPEPAAAAPPEPPPADKATEPPPADKPTAAPPADKPTEPPPADKATAAPPADKAPEPATTGAPAAKDRPPLPPEPVSGACSRRRAETDLRAQGPRRAPTRGQIDAELQRCFRARLAACQLALDAEVEEGLACWRQAPWPEVPPGVDPQDVSKTGMCVLELKAVISDLRSCRTKKVADRDACVTPYIGYTPQCALLSAERVWRMFPGRQDVERVARADAERSLAAKDPKAAQEAKRRAEQEAREAKLRAAEEAKQAKLRAAEEAKQAKLRAAEEAKQKAEEEKRLAEEARIAKETERCTGRTTLEFAEKLRAQPGPRSVPGCKYQVVGRVISQNNVFVQLVDPSGALIFLLRTKEPFAEGLEVADRTASFDSIEEVELADGSKRPFAVFKLDPAPKPKR